MWQDFFLHARISSDFLAQEKFQSHYVQGVFTHNDLILLFRKLLIFADFNKDQLFVPALLEKLQNESLDKYRCTSSPISPLVLSFGKHGGVLLGVFCATVVALLSEDEEDQSSWKLMIKKDRVSPTCLYRNCVQFDIQNYPGVVTLIDSFKHIEVHVNLPQCDNTTLLSTYCKKILNDLLKAIRKAFATLHYESIQPTLGFRCPCGQPGFHLAEIGLNDTIWICSIRKEAFQALDGSQLIWLAQQKVSWRDLDLLNRCGKKIRIIKQIASRWEDVARRLDIDYKRVERADSRDCDRACSKILNMWCNGEGRQPATWETFIEALEEAQFGELAEQIASMIN